LAEATAALRTKITADRGYQVVGTEMPTRTAQGVAGRQGGYSSPGREGGYAVFLDAGTGIEVTFAGADLKLNLPELKTSVASIVIGGR